MLLFSGRNRRIKRVVILAILLSCVLRSFFCFCAHSNIQNIRQPMKQETILFYLRVGGRGWGWDRRKDSRTDAQVVVVVFLKSYDRRFQITLHKTRPETGIGPQRRMN